MHNYSVKNILKLIKQNKLKIRLYLGLNDESIDGFLPLSMQQTADSSLIHSPLETPYPLPDGCCFSIVAREIFKIIMIEDFSRLVSEWSRLTVGGGILILRVPSGRNPFYKHIEKIYGCRNIWRPVAVRHIEDNKFVEYIFKKED